ncbi:hypothetical protein ACFQX4_25495 [Roseomonas sp. GCM10028921]
MYACRKKQIEHATAVFGTARVVTDTGAELAAEFVTIWLITFAEK